MAEDVDDTERRFVEFVLSNEHNRTILARAPELGAPDWWLTAGAGFQTVWNRLDDRAPDEGINNYDLFYFDDGSCRSTPRTATPTSSASEYGPTRSWPPGRSMRPRPPGGSNSGPG